MDQLSAQMLLSAYSKGVFPMAEDGKISWFSPIHRGIIPLDDRFRIRKSLRQSIRKKPFRITMNTAFREVMLACSEREETWIDEVIIDSYCELFDLGFGVSVECWDDEGLQGGLYGVALQKAFFGESMFSRKTDASKIALVYLVEWLRDNNFILLDTQWMTDHLKQFGGYEVPRDTYFCMLADALES